MQCRYNSYRRNYALRTSPALTMHLRMSSALNRSSEIYSTLNAVMQLKYSTNNFYTGLPHVNAWKLPPEMIPPPPAPSPSPGLPPAVRLPIQGAGSQPRAETNGQRTLETSLFEAGSSAELTCETLEKKMMLA